jgi:hypothetical protein
VSPVGNYLFLLLIVACPLMMIVMMRGMNSGHNKGGEDMGSHDMGGHDQDLHPDAHAPRDDQPADQRIGDLERQIAELRAERDHTINITKRP